MTIKFQSDLTIGDESVINPKGKWGRCGSVNE